MRYLTLGIIGHVDHGKTALVRALTGTDTDRLKEEKERGISIALGYARLELPSGEMGIVDAPGHERFIRTMIAGATGMAAVVLVVDVNEGVKPQTIEHLQIAELLGIRKGVVAVSKCDFAQPGRREDTGAELNILLHDTFMESAPVVFTSAETGEGLEDLRAALDVILAEAAPLIDEGYPYLPVDRVFTMSGFGTVVTGTLRRGALSIGDSVAVYPTGFEATIRELQVHDTKVERVDPGHRTAVNLRGVSKERIERGDAIAAAGVLRPAQILDVELRVLQDAKSPLTNRQPVRVLFGTKESIARVHLLDRNEIAPGDTACLQLRLDETVAVLHYEPFIVRFYSPMTTIGGGTILDTPERTYRRRDVEHVDRLRVYATGDPKAALQAAIAAAGRSGIDAGSLSVERRVAQSDIVRLLSGSGVINAGERYIGEAAFQSICVDVLSRVRAYHATHPTARGISSAELESHFPVHEANVLSAAIAAMIDDKRLASYQGLLHIPSFTPEGALSDTDRASAEAMERAFRDGGLTPPGMEVVVGGDKKREQLFHYLLREGVLIASKIDARGKAVNPGVTFHRDAVAEAMAKLRAVIGNGAAFTVPQAKDALNSSRKYLIPLLELLDRTQFTRRTGDTRQIVAKTPPGHNAR